jgi:hypothetical protein
VAAEEIRAIKRSQVLCTGALENVPRGHLKNMYALFPSKTQEYKGSTHLKDFALRRESWDTLLTQGCLGKCFLGSAKQALQQWSKGVWLLLKLAADLVIVHAMLVLQTCRM